MQALRRASLPRRVVAAVALLALLSACTKWKTTSDPVEQVIRERAPHEIRVRLADRSGYELRGPKIEGDTLRGLVIEYKRQRHPSRILAIPLEDVRELQVRKPDALKTTLLIAGVGVTALLVAEAVEAATEEEPPPPPRPPPSGPPVVSCPFVYTWDGEEWHLDSGTFGGAFLLPLSRTDVDNLAFARELDGELRLKLANELAETDFVDALSVLAVDHEPGVQVAPDPAGALHAFTTLAKPLSAQDYRGRDALARVVEADGWNWESSPSGRDTARVADLRDGLELVFARPDGARSARLILDGRNTPWSAYLLHEYIRLHGHQTDAWYDSVNADPLRAAPLGAKLASEAFLHVSVWTGDRWDSQGLIWEAGPEVSKRQALALDLSEVDGDVLRVRLESAPSLWLIDRVAIDYSREPSFSVRELHVETAIDAAGRDVRSLLTAADGAHYVLEPGDYAELKFRVPPVPDGLARSYVLRSHGWYRIHSPGVGEPDAHTLARIENEPLSIARLSVARMNEALVGLARRDLR
jgi:hypothetical protein